MSGQHSLAAAFAYVGTYSDGGKPWRSGRGLGIHQFAVDATSGRLSPLPASPLASYPPEAQHKSRQNPATLAWHPNSKLQLLYAAHEFDEWAGPHSTGSVSAFRQEKDGCLTFLADIACEGRDPAHISIHPDGKYLFTANYASGSVSVIALLPNGMFDTTRSVQVYRDADIHGDIPCPPGADVVPQAALCHEGFATSDHEAPHAHMVQTDPSGNFVLVADLGLDRMISYRFDRTTGALSQPQSTSVSASSGARHFIFHPNGRWLYVVNEEASNVALMLFNTRTGGIEWINETSTLPTNFKGTSYASGICMLADGKHFVVLNRLHDSIAIFSTDNSTGQPRLLGEEWTRGSFARSCTLDPTGKFLYVCHNKQSDNITLFEVDGSELHFSGYYVAVGSASMLVFGR